MLRETSERPPSLLLVEGDAFQRQVVLSLVRPLQCELLVREVAQAESTLLPRTIRLKAVLSHIESPDVPNLQLGQHIREQYPDVLFFTMPSGACYSGLALMSGFDSLVRRSVRARCDGKTVCGGGGVK